MRNIEVILAFLTTKTQRTLSNMKKVITAIAIFLVSIIIYLGLRYIFVFIAFFMFGEGNGSLLYNPFIYLVPLCLQILVNIYFVRKGRIGKELVVGISSILVLLFIAGYYKMFPNTNVFGIFNSPLI